MAFSAVAKRSGGGDIGKVRGTANGLELIWKSSEMYANILSSFRECHDLCVGSNLFDDDVVLKVDQCAVDFRQLSLDSVSIAKRVSNQWLDTALVTFENIKDIESPGDVLELLSTQARELSYCFKVIAAWAKDLGGRFHQAQDGTIREAKEFKKVFEMAIRNGEDKLGRLKAEKEEALKHYDECEKAVSSLKIKLRDAYRFNPFRLLWNSQLYSAENDLLEARESKEIIVENLRKTEEELQERRKKSGKAESITESAAKLKEMLANVESTCEAVAAYWATEAQRLVSQDPKKPKKKSAVMTSPKGDTIEERIAYWTKAKKEIDHYVMVMTKINNSFNFVTKATPPATQIIEYENLDITLRVPKSVGLKVTQNTFPISDKSYQCEH